MIDIKLIRENKELVKENIKKKFQDDKLPLVDEVYDLDIKYRETKTKADEARSKVNSLSKEIGEALSTGLLTDTNGFSNNNVNVIPEQSNIKSNG